VLVAVGMVVLVGTGVLVGIGVNDGTGVNVGPNACPGPQPERTRFKTMKQIATNLKYLFIVFLLLLRAAPGFC
jgi:hypothetical protein